MRTIDIARLASNCKRNSQSSNILSAHQEEALETVTAELCRSNKKATFLAGLAGTGKTEIVTRLGLGRPDIQYAAYTGKAASVLQRRGADNALTIHSLLYGAPSLIKYKHGQHLVWRRRSERITASLIIADECSMIDGKLARDLLATGVPVLVTGDLMQLPPVSGTAFFTNPDFVLTEIHRQAKDSRPLKMATAIREGRHIKPQRFDLDRIMDADIVIVAFERTRRHLNQIIRRAHGIKGHDPVVGDRVCCFRNNYTSGVLNGTLWTVQNVTEFTNEQRYLYRLELVDDVGTVTTVSVLEDYFHGADPRTAPYDHDDELDVFSYGYALTCHKSQGSEWDRVVVIDETGSPGFDRIIGDLSLSEFTKRWLYTAVTRAKQHFVLMEPPT
jgi:exodeoxyribonuclease-5